VAAALARANFGQAQQFLADAAAAQIGTHPEIVDEKPVAVGAAGQPRGDVAIRLADKDAEPLPFRVVQMRSIMLAELAAKPVTQSCRAFSPHARAKKLARAAECPVYSLTPSGVLAENHPKNRSFVGILRVKNA